ncbi:WD40-repeat-containing domain protein [Panaeolus papilionaceus]|nr:WD40-repeat-containing domain protein [Panaeolus papilionaceus]
MPRHARKKQKTAEAAPSKAARLEMLMDDEAKDDEERQLESMLFGVRYEPKDKGKRKDYDSADSDDDDDEGGREMQHLMDQDLFFVDDGVPSAPVTDSEEGGDEDRSHSGSDTDSGSDSQASSSSTRKRRTPKSLPKSLTSSRSKPPAWTDPADVEATNRVSLLNGPTRLRKLRQAINEDEITSREYETRLRAQFERINPEPSWARKARGKNKEAGDRESGTEDEEEGITNLLSSSTGILSARRRKEKGPVVLPQGSLNIERVRDANQSVQGSGSGEVRVITFHPKPSVPVLAVATADRRVRLFHIDGHLSPLISTLHVPTLPILNSSSVLFHPSGNSMLLSGPRPFFYTYDLQTGTSTMHRRGLWGSGFDDSSILSSAPSRKRRKEDGKGRGERQNTETIQHAAFSPATGSVLAVAGKGGNVHLVDWKSGAGQVIGSLKCTSSGGGGGGGVHGLWWVPSSGDGSNTALGAGKTLENDERHLAVLTGEAEVYIWDVAQRRCVRKWQDEGGYRGAGRVFAGGGGNSGWMAIGSTSGFVNVYGADSFSMPHNSYSSTDQPKLVKSLGHLTTPISTLKFNHDAQLLAMASKDKKDSMKLIHVPSLTAFANWPTSSTPLGHVSAVDFSARSEYVALGNTRGKVLLYHLKDYGASSGAGWV